MQGLLFCRTRRKSPSKKVEKYLKIENFYLEKTAVFFYTQSRRRVKNPSGFSHFSGRTTMKYIRFIMTLFCIALCFSLSAFAAQTVYLDGVGSDENCYATLVDAFTAVDGGGTVVVTAPVEGPTSSATTLPAKDGTVTVTSVYDGVDHGAENGAYYGIGRTLNLSSPVVFDDILLKQTSGSTTYGNIYACGNTLTVGAGVTTAADPTTGLYTNIYGGNSSGVFTGNAVDFGSYDITQNINTTAYKEALDNLLEDMCESFTNDYLEDQIHA